MAEKRKSTAAPLLAALAIVLPLLLLVLYATGYFWLGRREDVWLVTDTNTIHDPLPVAKPIITRNYNSRLLAWLYVPAATAESAVRQKEVNAIFDDR